MQTIRELFPTFTKLFSTILGLFRPARKPVLISQIAPTTQGEESAPQAVPQKENATYKSGNGSRTGKLASIDNSGRYVIRLPGGHLVRRQPHLVQLS